MYQKSCFKNRLFLLAFLMLCMGATPYSLQARTFYVSKSGDNRADVQDGAEFATLGYAIRWLKAGDTLVIRDGIHGSPGVVAENLNGTPESPIVIKGESLEAVIDSTSADNLDLLRLDHCSYVVVDGVTFLHSNRAGLGIIRCNHITVRNCVAGNNRLWGIFTGFVWDLLLENNECYGSEEQHGIYHSNSGDRFTIRNNRLHHNAGNGLHINGDPEIQSQPEDDGTTSEGIIEGNVIYENGYPKGGAGINMTHVHDVIVRNNLLYNNKAGGFTFYRDTGTDDNRSKRVLFLNNTVFFQPSEGRNVVNISNDSEKVVLINNILVGKSSARILQLDTQYVNTVVSDHNVFWGSSESKTVSILSSEISLDMWRTEYGHDLNTIYADPRFSSIGDSDFTPVTTSPAVDAGVDLDTVKNLVGKLEGMNWILTQLDLMEAVDLNGYVRPAGEAMDIGAFESGSIPADLSGDIDTGDWMGWVNVDRAPFLYSYSLEGWIYMTHFPTLGPGSWGYFFNGSGQWAP